MCHTKWGDSGRMIPRWDLSQGSRASHHSSGHDPDGGRSLVVEPDGRDRPVRPVAIDLVGRLTPTLG